MFQQVLYTQWKWSRFILLPAAIVGFGIPVLAVRRAAVDGVPWEILESISQWGFAFPVLALFTGLALAGAAWNADEIGKHVYALSLPLPRWHYVLLRFGAGAVLLVAVVAAAWVGNLTAVSTATIPEGLHAYPHSIALRFALAAFVSYAVFFAFIAADKRERGYAILVIGAPFIVQVLFGIAGSELLFIDDFIQRLIQWPGPLEIFSDPWLLINV